MVGTGANRAGNHYGLTVLCPIKLGTPKEIDESYESRTRARLNALECDEYSPFAKVPNTYFARLWILKDVFFESSPAKEEHLKSQYMVFAVDFHGDLDTYLKGMWDAQEAKVRDIWRDCVGFQRVTDAATFTGYIKQCQVTNALLFNGSTDESLAEQLKGLYLKQKFGEFAHTHQGVDAVALADAFKNFAETVESTNLAGPTWRPGASELDTVEVA